MAGFQRLILDGKEISKLFIDGKQCFPLVLENQNRNLQVSVTTLTDEAGILSLKVDLTYDGAEVTLDSSVIDGNGNWGTKYPTLVVHSNYSATITFYNEDTSPLYFDLVVNLPAENGYLAASWDAPYEVQGAVEKISHFPADIIADSIVTAIAQTSTLDSETYDGTIDVTFTQDTPYNVTIEFNAASSSNYLTVTDVNGNLGNVTTSGSGQYCTITIPRTDAADGVLTISTNDTSEYKQTNIHLQVHTHFNQ